MGLDMYLYKTKRVNGLTPEDYVRIDNIVGQDKEYTNLEEVSGIKGANELLSEVHQRGEYITWNSIFDKIGYWRKANHIHKWFVMNIQDGEDDCEYYEVPRSALQLLLSYVDEIIEDKSKAKELLPRQTGFFFGGEEYDEWYYEDIKNTKEIITNVLDTTDFDKEIVFYCSSW